MHQSHALCTVGREGSLSELGAHIGDQLCILLLVDSIQCQFAWEREASYRGRVKDRASLCQLPIPEPKTFQTSERY